MVLSAWIWGSRLVRVPSLGVSGSSEGAGGVGRRLRLGRCFHEASFCVLLGSRRCRAFLGRAFLGGAFLGGVRRRRGGVLWRLDGWRVGRKSAFGAPGRRYAGTSRLNCVGSGGGGGGGGASI